MVEVDTAVQKYVDDRRREEVSTLHVQEHGGIAIGTVQDRVGATRATPPRPMMVRTACLFMICSYLFFPGVFGPFIVKISAHLLLKYGTKVEKRLQKAARDKKVTEAEKSGLAKLLKALEEGGQRPKGCT